jgi:hypothetical protein
MFDDVTHSRSFFTHNGMNFIQLNNKCPCDQPMRKPAKGKLAKWSIVRGLQGQLRFIFLHLLKRICGSSQHSIAKHFIHKTRVYRSKSWRTLLNWQNRTVQVH